jgi:hypothetical protein
LQLQLQGQFDAEGGDSSLHHPVSEFQLPAPSTSGTNELRKKRRNPKLVALQQNRH